MSLSIQKGSSVKPETPQVSVIVPCYNSADFITETLDSIFAQTFTDFEVIIVNDGSPDTEEFEKNIAPYFEKIIYLKKENVGVSSARNVGIEIARGEFIAFLDSDDVWFPHFLESQINYLKKNSLDLVYSDAHLFGETKGLKTFMEKCPSSGEVTLESLISFRCIVLTSSVVVRKQLLQESGGFDETVHIGEDFDLWTRMVANGAKIGYQKEHLLRYRVRVGSLSNNPLRLAEMNIASMERVRRKIKLLPELESLVEHKIEFFRAHYALENGKRLLLQEKFSESCAEFKNANSFFKSLKLRAVILSLKISPRILLRFFKAVRAEDIESLKTMPF